MKNIVCASIFILANIVFASAQTTGDFDCPTISINGPSGFVKPNDLAIYKVQIDTKGKNLKLEYFWAISAGKIINGQSTQTITVKQPETGVTATVEIDGLPENCSNTASETATYDLPPQPVKLDEYSGVFSQFSKSRFHNIISNVQNDPNSKLFIINRYKKSSSEANIIQQTNKIKNYLIKVGINAEQITFINAPARSDLMEFWLVPAGATPPRLN